MRRIKTAGLTAAVFLLPTFLILFGCAKEDGQPPKKAVSSIIVWHWMTDREQTFLELAKRYEQDTGVRINFELYAPSEAYSQKVRAAAQGATLPDVFSVLGEKRDFSAFVKAGYIRDLTPYMEENNSSWKNKFSPKALAVNEFLEGNN